MIKNNPTRPLFAPQVEQESTWAMVRYWAKRSSELLVKKLSRNDTSWAEGKSNQAGFYVPANIRASDFFPELVADNPEKLHILHAECPTFWPQTGEVKPSGWRHFTNKGPEAHFTVIPKEPFIGLSPASLLVGGKLRESIDGVWHWFVVLDSSSDSSEFIETALDLPWDFHSGLFDPGRLETTLPRDELLELIEQITIAIRLGQLDKFLKSVSSLPRPEDIALEAQEFYLAHSGRASLNPFEIECPGDVIMLISRDIEYSIFKRLELRRRATEVVNVLSSGQTDLVTSVVRGFAALDTIFLSASQQRKTRAGRSFEHHISRTLTDGGVAFEEQAVMGGRRPDFVLPSARVLRRANARAFNDAAILSAKTSLRERWKQLSREDFKAQVYLATVDDRVPGSAIAEMEMLGIVLVVPESLKASNETCYPSNSNVISFSDFFNREVLGARPFLLK
jgi:hypothetical protein